MSGLTAEVRKTLVKLADTSLVGQERTNYEIRYKRYAGEILDHYNAIMKDGTSLVSDGDYYNSIYTAPHKVVANVEGRQTTIGDYDPTGGSMTLSGFTDPNGTSGARNKEDLAQSWAQVFLNTGSTPVTNSQGVPSELQTIHDPRCGAGGGHDRRQRQQPLSSVAVRGLAEPRHERAVQGHAQRQQLHQLQHRYRGSQRRRAWAPSSTPT